METLIITQPDDWHLHLRDQEFLARTVPDAAKQLGRAIVMPNLASPIVDISQAQNYLQRIIEHVPAGNQFKPLMTLYLTEDTSSETIHAAKVSGIIYACKLYPAHATTHSEYGIKTIEKLYPLFATMAEVGLPLLIHGEVTDPHVDVFDREKVFINTVLTSLVKSFPSLKIVLEHITTQEAVKFVSGAPKNVAATITAHHLLFNRNAIFVGGINPHHYCLPVLKRDIHQQVLIVAATSGNPKFFLGSDSAPHSVAAKECHHGCAGIYSSHATLELYVEAFARANALHKLEAFASFHGADFYGLPRNSQKIKLVAETWQVPERLSFGATELVPLWAGRNLQFKFRSVE